MILLEGIEKSYQGRQVLHIPRLQLLPGMRYGVIGPNGSGKSTLLRILAGVLRPDKGELSIPEDVKDSIGYMPQQPYAYDISVLKNVLLAMPGGDKAANQKQAEQALESVGMSDFLGASGSRLSGGETQRMALARILCRPRSLLILDEPSSATDIAGNTLVEQALKSYFQSSGCTAVFSTHSLAQVQRLADCVLVLDRGIIVEQGDAAHVLKRPASQQAQAFLRYWVMD